MEWCRLATGAVGVMKMAFGATYGYLAFHESTGPDVLLCLIGAAASTLWGGVVLGMARYPRKFKQYDVPQQDEDLSVHELNED